MAQPKADLIQNPKDILWVQPTPLILFHDGGGTIFSYYMLGELRRPLYGISNPHYGKDGTFPGGVPEMARLYVDMIRRAVPAGCTNIIIGGWSLGGLTSLEVARILAEDDQLKVIGIVMIDAVCPTFWKSSQPDLVKLLPAVMEWNENTRQETRDAVSRCFAEATKMAQSWKLPTWGDEGGENGNGNGNGVVSKSAPLRPPPVILLKAKESVPVNEDGVSRVDVFRHDPKLGWENYRKDLVTQVVEVPGHHFNIFKTEWRLDIITEKIRRACLDIERMSRS